MPVPDHHAYTQKLQILFKPINTILESVIHQLACFGRLEGKEHYRHEEEQTAQI